MDKGGPLANSPVAQYSPSSNIKRNMHTAALFCVFEKNVIKVHQHDKTAALELAHRVPSAGFPRGPS